MNSVVVAVVVVVVVAVVSVDSAVVFVGIDGANVVWNKSCKFCHFVGPSINTSISWLVNSFVVPLPALRLVYHFIFIAFLP